VRAVIDTHIPIVYQWKIAPGRRHRVAAASNGRSRTCSRARGVGGKEIRDGSRASRSGDAVRFSGRRRGRLLLLAASIGEPVARSSVRHDTRRRSRRPCAIQSGAWGDHAHGEVCSKGYGDTMRDLRQSRVKSDRFDELSKIGSGLRS